MVPRRTPAAADELRASLVEHAQHLIRRDGAQALTMRALAAEAGCSVGLPYKVFENREQLVVDLATLELRRLRADFEAWKAQAGARTVGQNLDRFAGIVLGADTPALILAERLDHASREAVVDNVKKAGLLRSLDTTMADYLRAEQRLGRVGADVDAGAYGFLITGAIHNLTVAGDTYPRPDRRRLRRMLNALAAHLTPSVPSSV